MNPPVEVMTSQYLLPQPPSLNPMEVHCIGCLLSWTHLWRWWHHRICCPSPSAWTLWRFTILVACCHEPTCGGDDITVSVAPAPKLEPSWQGEVARDLNRSSFRPHIHQVTLGPAVYNNLTSVNLVTRKKVIRSTGWQSVQITVITDVWWSGSIYRKNWYLVWTVFCKRDKACNWMIAKDQNCWPKLL